MEVSSLIYKFHLANTEVFVFKCLTKRFLFSSMFPSKSFLKSFIFGSVKRGQIR